MRTRHYVHGYTPRENTRLMDQSRTLAGLLHHGTKYQAGSKVLEVGCGVGAQTRILAKNSPRARFVCMDISESSVRKARRRVRREHIHNAHFQIADIFRLPFPDETFDHLFICFVLEHLAEPVQALRALKRVLKKGGTLTVIEGDHGSCYFYPETVEALKAWQSLIDAQARLGGDSLIGRRLFPLLTQAGFRKAQVSPKFVYVDSSRPALVDGFIKRTIIAMVKGVKKRALAMKLMDKKSWTKGVRDLYRTARANGTFCYAFFKGSAIK